MNLQAFYQVRGNLYKFFKKYETIIQAVIKFVGFLVIFRIISGSEMFEGGGPLNSFWLQLVLAAVATVLPNRCGVLIAILLGGYNIITASLIGGILLLVLMLVLYIITARFTPEYAYFMLVIPLCIHTKFYLLVPLLAGMYIGTISVIPIVTGTLMWGIVRMIPAFLAIQSGELELSQLPQILTSASTYGYEQLLKNNELIFIAATLVVVMLTGQPAAEAAEGLYSVYCPGRRRRARLDLSVDLQDCGGSERRIFPGDSLQPGRGRYCRRCSVYVDSAGL